MVHVALFRGINVGGNNILPMKSLAEIFVGAGAHKVRTYIQSGNVIFDADGDAARAIAAEVRKRVQAQFKIDSPIILRTDRELDVISRTRAVEGPEERLYVMFLERAPSVGLVERLDPMRSPGDEFRVIGSEIFLMLGNGAARTKLTNAYFDSKLDTVSTSRNWRTVTKLSELMGSA